MEILTPESHVMKKHVVNVFLHYRYSSFLLQLRDFIPTIANPGQWGAFGGGVEPGEEPISAAYREVDEELHYIPETIHKFQTFSLDQLHLKSHVFYCELTVPLSELIQSEGIDMGIFEKDEIFTGKLYSQKLKFFPPVAPVLIPFFKEFFNFIEPRIQLVSATERKSKSVAILETI